MMDEVCDLRHAESIWYSSQQHARVRFGCASTSCHFPTRAGATSGSTAESTKLSLASRSKRVLVALLRHVKLVHELRGSRGEQKSEASVRQFCRHDQGRNHRRQVALALACGTHLVEPVHTICHVRQVDREQQVVVLGQELLAEFGDVAAGR